MSVILDAIETKKVGGDLDGQTIAEVVTGYTSGDVPDEQMSALLMAIFLQGMSYDETLALTRVMIPARATRSRTASISTPPVASGTR